MKKLCTKRIYLFLYSIVLFPNIYFTISQSTPHYPVKGKGIGRKIINTLEQDEFYVRATRIEIPASITATEFYRKFGYDYKNGVKELDEERHYRLEKFKEVWI